MKRRFFIRSAVIVASLTVIPVLASAQAMPKVASEAEVFELTLDLQSYNAMIAEVRPSKSRVRLPNGQFPKGTKFRARLPYAGYEFHLTK